MNWRFYTLTSPHAAPHTHPLTMHESEVTHTHPHTHTLLAANARHTPSKGRALQTGVCGPGPHQSRELEHVHKQKRKISGLLGPPLEGDQAPGVRRAGPTRPLGLTSQALAGPQVGEEAGRDTGLWAHLLTHRPSRIPLSQELSRALLVGCWEALACGPTGPSCKPDALLPARVRSRGCCRQQAPMSPCNRQD